MNPNYPYYFNEFPIPYYNSPAYIAHYIYQSEETYVERKLNLPRDDDGTYRTDYRKHNEFKKIHNVYNNIEFYFDKKYTCESVIKELFIRGIKDHIEKNGKSV